MQGNTHTLITTPIVTKEKFKQISGLRVNQTQGQLQRGNLQHFKVGGLTLVNLMPFIQHSYALASPIMTAEEFGHHCGMDKKSIDYQIQNGNLPTQRVGRLVLIDLQELVALCIEQAQPTTI